ncbi:unnamed protein product, partial [Staurois parvus]
MPILSASVLHPFPIPPLASIVPHPSLPIPPQPPLSVLHPSLPIPPPSTGIPSIHPVSSTPHPSLPIPPSTSLHPSLPIPHVSSTQCPPHLSAS